MNNTQAKWIGTVIGSYEKVMLEERGNCDYKDWLSISNPCGC